MKTECKPSGTTVIDGTEYFVSGNNWIVIKETFLERGNNMVDLLEILIKFEFNREKGA